MFMPGVWFLSSKKILLFFTKKREILLHFWSVLQWKVLKKWKRGQIYYYDPQSAGINVQSPQCESTPRRLTLQITHFVPFFGSLETWEKKGENRIANTYQGTTRMISSNQMVQYTAEFFVNPDQCYITQISIIINIPNFCLLFNYNWYLAL